MNTRLSLYMIEISSTPKMIINIRSKDNYVNVEYTYFIVYRSTLRVKDKFVAKIFKSIIEPSQNRVD